MIQKFVIVAYGDPDVGDYGFQGEVEFNVDDGVHDEDYIKDSIDEAKKFLKEFYGQESKVDVYTFDEWMRYEIGDCDPEDQEDPYDNDYDPNGNDGYPL